VGKRAPLLSVKGGRGEKKSCNDQMSKKKLTRSEEKGRFQKERRGKDKKTIFGGSRKGPLLFGKTHSQGGKLASHASCRSERKGEGALLILPFRGEEKRFLSGGKSKVRDGRWRVS